MLRPVVTESRDLAAQIAEQGPRAFGPVVRATQDRLYRVALRILGDPTEAEDAVQDAYVRAFDALSAGRYDERLRLDSWLVTIVSRVAIDLLRGRRVRQLALVRHDADLARGGDEAQLAAAYELGCWLDALVPDQRVVVVLKFMEGMTSAEVGGVLGISEGAVEQRIVRARAALRKRATNEA